jgi:hypothetical protein
MSRSAESMRLEMDYARLVLDDLLELNDLTLAASEALSQLPLEVLTLTLAVRRRFARDSLDRIGASTSSAMDVLKRMSDGIGRLVELSSGRQLAVAAELAELREERDGS